MFLAIVLVYTYFALKPMIKVYVNDCPLAIASPADYQSANTQGLIRVENNLPALTKVIEWMLAAPSKGYITITAEPQQTFELLQTACHPIHAAGGVVFNHEGKILMIRRMNRWDLPKGKVDPGETWDFTAIREVKEECGLSQLKLQQPVGETLHIYMQKGTKMLKTTHWYRMECEGNPILIPQTEEHITEAKWMDINDKTLKELDTYETIRGLLQIVLKEHL